MGFLVTAGAGRFRSPPAPGLQAALTAALHVAETLAVRDFLADTGLTRDDSCYYALACVAFAGHRAGRVMWEFPSVSSGYVRVACPGCGAESEVDGFADPLAPPCPAPAFFPASGSTMTWHDVAGAVERANRDQVLGPGWAGFFDTAGRVAAAGVPPRASSSAVWCLVAAMVVTGSAEAAPWARTLARLAGHVRCAGCGMVWAIADLAAATSDAITMWDLVSGSPGGPPLAGPAGAVASIALPAGGTVIAAARDDGTLRWWDAPAGQRLDGAVTAGPACILSLAPVLMPPEPDPRTAGWLSRLRDGRTLLAAGDADGMVRPWDPVTRTPLAELFRRGGRPVVSMTAVDFVGQPPWRGTDLVAVYDDPAIDVWPSASVHGNRSAMAPTRKLVADGHQRLIGVAVSPRRLGYRKPVLLADRNGTVSMWETFGLRLSDPLPPDPAHREITGIIALPGPDDGITVATASRAEPSLRIWEPAHGTLRSCRSTSGRAACSMPAT